MLNFKNQDLFRAVIGTVGMLACTAACLFAATAASADPGSQSVGSQAVSSQAVGIADLDLSTLHGRLVLDRRLKRAADEVCAPQGAYSFGEDAARRRCVSEAMARVQPRVTRALHLYVEG